MGGQEILVILEYQDIADILVGRDKAVPLGIVEYPVGLVNLVYLDIAVIPGNLAGAVGVAYPA